MKPIQRHLKLIIALALLVLCSSYGHLENTTNVAINHSKDEPHKHIMVVFIHGTLLPIFSPSALGSSLHSYLSHGRRLQKSWYQLYLDKLKTTSTYRYQPSGPDGLHYVGETKQTCARLAASIYQQLFTEPCSCYTFGWNGRLSHHKRRQAARQLYTELCDEIGRLKVIHPNLEVVVIGHSHGGNVALHLAHVEKKVKRHLNIDKLILLGTPIQSETERYAHAACFKKVYNFYSHGDQIQKIDILSTHDDWSKRHLADSNNIVQIDLTCGKTKPGHTELWLFCGKENWLYRKKLSIAPFPFVAFLPTVLHEIDTHYPQARSIRLNIEKKPNKLSFIFSDHAHHSTACIDEKLLHNYKKTIVQL
jgi:hypothetical protein